MKSFDGGANDFAIHLRHPFRCGKRHGRNGAHAAGIETGVAFADAFIVFRFGQDLVVAAVGEHEDGAFDARKEFFDDHARRSVAKLSAEHFAERILRFFEGGENQNPLTGAQSVGLQHIGCCERGEKCATFFHLRAVEGAIGGRGDVVALHKRLGEVFRAFQHGTGFRRTDNGDVSQGGTRREIVVDALDQRVFRTDNDHVDVLLEHKTLNAFEVVGAQSDVGAHLRRAGITGGDKKLLDFGTLSDFPSQCVFATAGSKQKKVHNDGGIRGLCRKKRRMGQGRRMAL